ncbi:DUF6492 family protein [Chelativorans sp. M5D2P16]|uniref:DUF6492 family protein n=1 Tax=Chelativorans sp. M5D2P16 TaxID=3095678 RepID=UPI002ACAFA64|nr:DUF6492 family protein [Chelativorans sp. M5D2P16]MDZ5698894.1 DUF6492 family protein [Chelativorans sp. M5D2P16]
MTRRALVQDAAARSRPAPEEGDAALVTPSYAGDFERCRLLCETVDRFVSGAAMHYLLVSSDDVARFRALDGPNRIVIDERDLLPGWLHSLPDPVSLFRRRIWLSTRTPPLRGWHVQQLRRIAIAGQVREATLVYCDSDVVFLKPFDVSAFRQNGKLRLYRREGALPVDSEAGHGDWYANAGFALALTPEASTRHDYISTVIAWDRQTVAAMVRHIEAIHARHWVEVVAARRRFSECILYGRYVDEILGGEGHFHDAAQFCRVYWSGPSLDETGLRGLIGSMEPEQVAIGVQSFTETDLEPLRRLVA